MEHRVKKIEDFNAEDRIDLRLLEKGTFYLNGEINEDSVGECIKWLIYENLDSADRKSTRLNSSH